MQFDGHEVTNLPFADNGLPFVAESIITTEQMIAEKPDLVKAFLEAEILGWQDYLRDPEEGARLAVEEYGADLDLDIEKEVEQANVQSDLIVTEDVEANGLLTITDELIEQNLATLAAAGIDLTDADDLFDLSLLDELLRRSRNSSRRSDVTSLDDRHAKPSIPATAGPAGTGIHLEGLSKTFGHGRKQVTALEDATLHTDQGSFLSLLGPRGAASPRSCGSSRGSSSRSSGTALVDGRTPVELRRDHGLGIAFQDSALLPWRSVRTNIRLPLRDVRRRPIPPWSTS